MDTIIKEQVKDSAKEESKEEPKGDFAADDGERVVINNKGIRLRDSDGGTVVIDGNGIVCTDKDGNVTKKRRHGEHERDKAMSIIGFIEGVLTLLCIVGYVLLGFLMNLWLSAWILIFVPEIICSVARAIRRKNAHQFNMPFLATFAYLFFCLFMPQLIEGFPALWHPLWVVFFAIPIYYTIVSIIHKAIGKEEERKDDDDDDDEEDDE